MNMNLNNNTSECIHSVLGWGIQTYYNICANTTTVIPWGIDEWIGAFASVIFFVIFTLIFWGIFRHK